MLSKTRRTILETKKQNMKFNVLEPIPSSAVGNIGDKYQRSKIRLTIFNLSKFLSNFNRIHLNTFNLFKLVYSRTCGVNFRPFFFFFTKPPTFWIIFHMEIDFCSWCGYQPVLNPLLWICSLLATVILFLMVVVF